MNSYAGFPDLLLKTGMWAKIIRQWMRLSLLLLLGASSLCGNGGAYGTVSQGLAFRNEPRIVLASERLIVSPRKIRVEYEFRNNGRNTVLTDILFPVGAHFFGCEGDYPVGTGFKLWEGGIRRRVKVHYKAILPRERQEPDWREDPFMDWGGEDVSSLVGALGLLDENFGISKRSSLQPGQLVALWRRGLSVVRTDWDNPSSMSDEELLSEAKKVLDGEDYSPNWLIYESYRWRQCFPARSSTRLVIEYVPDFIAEDTLKLLDWDATYEGYPNLESPNRSLRQEALRQISRRGLRCGKGDEEIAPRVFNCQVQYVLTTANTWQGPIGRFELVVKGGRDSLASFVWPRPFERIALNTYRVRKRNFKPRRDLVVHFWDLPRTCGLWPGY